MRSEVHQLVGCVFAALAIVRTIGTNVVALYGGLARKGCALHAGLQCGIGERGKRHLHSITLRHKNTPRRDHDIASGRVVKNIAARSAIGCGGSARRSSLTWSYFVVIFSSLAVVQAGWCKLVRSACVRVGLRKDNNCPYEIFFSEFFSPEIFAAAIFSTTQGTASP
jgi:hypothetical protein